MDNHNRHTRHHVSNHCRQLRGCRIHVFEYELLHCIAELHKLQFHASQRHIFKRVLGPTCVSLTVETQLYNLELCCVTDPFRLRFAA